MFSLLLCIVMFAIVGFVVGCGRLFWQHQDWYRKFLEDHPILGWTATFVAGGTALYAALWALFYAVVLFLVALGISLNTGVVQ